MENASFHPLDYVSVLRRRMWWFIAPVVLSVIVAAALVTWLPREYKTQATLGVSLPALSPDLLKQTGRVTYEAVTDQEALEAFQLLARLEGIIPALECAHALAYLVKLVPRLSQDAIVILCVSGRGDKDVAYVEALLAQGGT